MRPSLLLFVLVLLVGANIFIYRAALAPSELRVFVLDVGDKGDSVLVETPGGRMLLIDTGPDASILRALGGALPEWQRRIDAIMLTSPVVGAMGGLLEVRDRYRLGALLRSGAQGSKSVETALAEAASAEPGLQEVALTRGARLALGDGIIADILWPGAGIGAMKPADSVLVLRISYGATAFIIEENLSARSAAWLAILDPGASPSTTSFFISSSTPAGTYISDGREIIKK